MKKATAWSATFLLVLSFTTLTAPAQDFQKSYSLGQGARISVKNVSGEILVSGYNGRDVQVAAWREGPDAQLVQIVDETTAQGVSLGVQYPREGNCNASVRFDIKVPRGIEFAFDSLSNASGDVSVQDVTGTVRARTASGNVGIQQVQGNIDASSASGDVTVRQAVGVVNARTASGNVEVELLHQTPGDEMKFSSASGDVTVKAPGNLDAMVEMSTASGDLQTDFQLTIEDRAKGSGKSAHGQLGSGSCHVKLSTASGNVRLTH